MNKQNKGNGNRGIEWRTIPGYEGLYEVSNDGRVRSLPHSTTKGRILAQQLNNSGYFRVNIRWAYRYVHHLVALAFIGIRPEGADINHINGIKTDNRASNLEYVSRAENMQHARQHGLHDNRGEKAWNAKLTAELVTDIRTAFQNCGVNEHDIAIDGISQRAIKDVLERKTWRHI